MKNYGKISRRDSRWVVTEMEPHVCLRFRHIFPSIPQYKALPFYLPARADIASDIVWFMGRYPLEISPEDKLVLDKSNRDFLNSGEELNRILDPFQNISVPSKIANMKIKLRDYQVRAVMALAQTGILLLGDDVGLGKTACGIAAALLPNALPAIVVVQTHLARQWDGEIGKFTDLTTHIVSSSRPYKLPMADYYIMTYSKMHGWTDYFSKSDVFGLVTFDEAQELRRGQEAKKGEVAMVLARQAKYVLSLTATPVYNYGNEIFNILNTMREGCLGRDREFYLEWCSSLFSGKVKEPKALGTYLRETKLFLRRTRQDVGRELPEVTVVNQEVGYEQDVVESSEALARKLANLTLNGTFVERGQSARELDLLLRQATGIAKAPHVAEYVKMILESGEKVLLMGWHRAVYDIWLEKLDKYNPVMYTGTENPAHKEKAKQDFIHGKSQLLIMSLRSGVGLDGLQEVCSTVVFGEFDWSPEVHYQIIGRLRRDGQENKVLAVYVWTDWGSDPLMIDLLGVKKSQAMGIISPELGIAEVQSGESRLRELARKFLGEIPEKVEEVRSEPVEQGGGRRHYYLPKVFWAKRRPHV